MAEATSAQQAATLRCFLLPLRGINLLLPATTVVEVAEFGEPQPEPGTPEWYRGVISWRGLIIPLVAYEGFLGFSTEGSTHRMVVLNTLNQNDTLPFVALEIEALPRLVPLKADGVASEQIDSGVDTGYVLSKVKLADAEAFVPDIDTLENMLIDMGVKVS